MKWLSVLSQIFLQYSAQQQRLLSERMSAQFKEAPEKIKGMTVQAAVYFVGLVFLIAFTLASIVMIFVNLGTQWDSDVHTHWTGTFTAAVLLFALGVVAFLVAMLLAKYLARKKAEEAPKGQDAPPSPPPAAEAINPLLVFGEEFLKQLLTNLNKPEPPQ